MENQFLSVSLEKDKLVVKNKILDKTINFAWPAITISIDGKIISPQQDVSEPVSEKDCLSQKFEEDGILFEVSVTLSDKSWFNKKVVIKSDKKLPTPDFLEVDGQTLPEDDLVLRGYLASTPLPPKTKGEEGSGIMPGCGYPLIGKNFFIGLEHPAGFSLVENINDNHRVSLRHYPVWEGNTIVSESAVFGWTENAEKSFEEYLDYIRLGPLKKPFVCFCTFWSDPYLGDHEYAVSLNAYKAFFNAFCDFGLIPDAFTLDAGWNERNSVFEAKKDVEGDEGLIELRKLVEEKGSTLSLWVSHNGPMGIATEHMKKLGFEIGKGNSAAYSGDGYGVMMDKKFIDTLTGRFKELVERIGTVHMKIDWDNDCATNDKFNEIYPTVNHVREASTNVFFEVGRQLRDIDPKFMSRNGWWVSPWWLPEANHVFLSDSGDSEYAAHPSKTQRDAATTHRDLMYYNCFQRDKSVLPLECFDNHEFPDANRNPFTEPVNTWVDTVWWSFLRGSSYLTYTLHPESLEDWQVKSLKGIMEFCRVYAENIFVPHGKMILGHPGKGEIYGFIHPGPEQTWCAIRNPLPIPQSITLDIQEKLDYDVKSAIQFYPHLESFDLSNEVTFLAHEIKLFVLLKEPVNLEFSHPFMLESNGDEYLYKFPSTMEINETIQPLADPVQRINKMECLDFEKEKNDEGQLFKWFLRIPPRTRNCELQFRISDCEVDKLNIKGFTSRYKGCINSNYALPITKIPVGLKGHGERKNADVSCNSDNAYFAAAVPDGGEFGLLLQISGIDEKDLKLEAWISGYEAPSRNGLTKSEQPSIFKECVPCQHPLGFPGAMKIL